jgi:hypothetical protein
MKYLPISVNRSSSMRVIPFLQACRGHFVAIYPVLLLLTFPLWIVNLGKELLWDRFPHLGATFPGGTWGFNLIVIASILPVMFASLVIYTDQFIRDRRRHLISALRQTLSRIGDLLLGSGLSLSVFLAVSKLISIPLGSSALSIYWQVLVRLRDLSGPKILFIILAGSALAYLGGLISLFFCTIVLDNCSPFQAIQQSGKILQGRWWPLAKTLFGSALILLPLFGGLGFLILRGARGLEPLFLRVFSHHAVSLGLEEISQDVYRSLVTAFLSVYIVTLYRSLRPQRDA